VSPSGDCPPRLGSVCTHVTNLFENFSLPNWLPTHSLIPCLYDHPPHPENTSQNQRPPRTGIVPLHHLLPPQPCFGVSFLTTTHRSQPPHPESFILAPPQLTSSHHNHVLKSTPPSAYLSHLQPCAEKHPTSIPSSSPLLPPQLSAHNHPTSTFHQNTSSHLHPSFSASLPPQPSAHNHPTSIPSSAPLPTSGSARHNYNPLLTTTAPQPLHHRPS
jgi:hypothetical protein